jgi:hypothetical protein
LTDDEQRILEIGTPPPPPSISTYNGNVTGNFLRLEEMMDRRLQYLKQEILWESRAYQKTHGALHDNEAASLKLLLAPVLTHVADAAPWAWRLADVRSLRSALWRNRGFIGWVVFLVLVSLHVLEGQPFDFHLPF